MARRSHSLALATGLALAQPLPAAAYPIDCAILLCLAGGWPLNLHCDAARAEVIRRVTPWPIEPPLQLWRCPMGGGSTTIGGETLDGSGSTAGASDPVLGLVASLRVHHVRFSQRTTGGGGMGEECQRSDATEVGAYDAAGGFAWHDGVAAAVPSGPGLSSFDPPPGCRAYRYRAVAVSWTDALGGRGFEEVRY